MSAAFASVRAIIKVGVPITSAANRAAMRLRIAFLGGKVLLPTQNAIRNLIAARFAADVMGTPTLIMARTDANAADMVTSDVDPADAEFITGERTPEGFYRTKAGIDQAIARGLAYAPYAD